LNQRTIPLRDLDEERTLFGNLDRNLHLLRRLYDVDAVSRGGLLTLSGEPRALADAAAAVTRALDLIRSDPQASAEDLERIFRGSRTSPGEGDDRTLRRLVEPRSPNQGRYLDAIEANVVTFAIGPAGSGKTYLAVAMAVAYMKAGLYRRLILCRPAVEAGESLGFLPGDLAAKINPYLRPLYDSLYDFLPPAQVQRYIEEDVIEVLPLAYMRGRTLDRAVVILDEAQNTTVGQMKMALTRLGEHSKMIVTGDVTQVDLPQPRESGLLRARRTLSGIEGVSFIHLSKADIVRHPVVAAIVKAYSREEESSRSASRHRLAGEARPEGLEQRPGADGSRRGDRSR